MADGRRQLANSRTSTPKPTAQGPGDHDDVLSKAVGTRVKIVTAAPSSTTLEGTIFAVCRMTNILAINTAPLSTTPGSNSASQPGDFHLIQFSRIQSLHAVAPSGPREATPSGFANLQPAIARVDVKALKTREEAAIRSMKERDATRGKGVTGEAQDIFDGITRTLPVRWHGTSIIVSDAVLIVPPYELDNCSAPKDKQAALVRVKKVLEHVRRQIVERTTKTAVAATVDEPRKGG